MPSTWTQMKSGERFTKVELDANSEEYKGVEQSVRATYQNNVKQIIKVFSSVVFNICSTCCSFLFIYYIQLV